MANTRITPTEHQERTAKYRHDVDDYIHDEDDDPDPYVDLIQRDPVVCDTCFLLRYDVVSCDFFCGELRWLSYEKWEGRPDANEHIPRGTSAQGMMLVCKNCGHGEKMRPIPKHLVDEYAENLSATLRCKGIDHDPDVLLSEVLRRNDQSENQGRQDTEVFQPAVKLAIDAKQNWKD